MISTNIFTIIKQNQTLKETRETNIKSQLALEQARRTHDEVNSSLAKWKDDFFAKAFLEGEKAGTKTANERTDTLAAAGMAETK